MSLVNPTKAPTAIVIPLRRIEVEYHENILTRLVPERIKNSVRSMTEGELHAAAAGIRYATIINTLAWTLFVTVR